MPDNKAKKTAADPQIALAEYCRRLSERERRFVRVSGFHAYASAKGLERASEKQFNEAYQAYLKQQA